MSLSLKIALATLALLALTAPSRATCGEVTCPELSDVVCGACEVAFKKSNEGVDDPCCKTFACKPDPEQPCCGVTCPTVTEELAACNLFEERSEIANMLDPAYGTRKGKCCDKYRCEVDFEAVCRNLTAVLPCATSADCGMCSTPQITSFADPAAGRCCPDFTCNLDKQCLCDMRDEPPSCPIPTCDPLEDLVLTEQPDPEANDCCAQYACQPNNARICEAQLAFEGYTGPSCPSCELPIIISEARPERLRCKPEFVCVPDPTDRCCGFDNSTCAAPPTCGAFEYLNQTREIDIIAGQCCEEFTCFKNFTAVCANLPCPYKNSDDYQAQVCPNPIGRDWFFVEIRQPADIEAGICCPTYACRETVEKQIYDLEQQSSRRRRRRRQN